MSVIRQTISTLLIEGKIEDLQAKYPALIVKEIAKEDPTQQKKYLAWMCLQLSMNVKENDLYPTIRSFDNNLARIEKKDINSYKTLKELEDVIKALPEKSKTKQRQQIKGNAPKIYEDENCLIVRPDDKNSCIVYGSGTKWCITMKDEGYYEQYTHDNVVFYFIISKKLEQSDQMAKIAIAVLRDQIDKITSQREIEPGDYFDIVDLYDAEDNQRDASEVDQNILKICIDNAMKRPVNLGAKIKKGIATQEELMSAAKNDDEKIRNLVATSEYTPGEILALLAKDKNRDVKFSVAGNENTLPETLIMLASDENLHVRNLVATNKNTPPEVLTNLAEDESMITRAAVAENANTPIEVLRTLAKDNENDIRVLAAVADNERIPQDVQNQLLRSNDEFVLRTLASNIRVAPSILHALIKRGDVVRARVAFNISTPKKTLRILARDNSPDVIMGVASNKNTDPEILELLSFDSPEVARWVAYNLSTPISLLNKLAKNKDVSVRMYVAANASTPKETLEALLRDESRAVANHARHTLNKLQTNESKNFMRVSHKQLKEMITEIVNELDGQKQIDLSQEPIGIIQDIYEMIAGAETAMLYSPWDSEFGTICFDDEELQAEVREDDIVVTTSRNRMNDEEFARKIVADFEAKL